MRISAREFIKGTDWRLLLSSSVLVGIGLVLIYTLTWPQDNRFIKQLIFFGIGLALVFFLRFLDVHFWRNASFLVYAVLIIFLLGLLIFGESTRGARGWVALGPAVFQPAEFMKIATILFLATTLEKLHFDLVRFRHLLLALFIVGLPVVLILLQPDFGSAFIVLASSSVMLLYTGLDKKKLFILIVGSIVIGVIAWFGVLHPYQKERILTFLNPQSDPLGAGYNVRQSMVAIGSGGWLGRGLGLGPQSQLNFLPEQETDFIFASLAEEFGFAGSFLLLAIYFFFLWRIYKAMQSGENLFSNYLLLGIFTLFLTQIVVNVGMNMGLFPVTGITLPFLSYGGSSLVVSFWGIGLIMSLRR